MICCRYCPKFFPFQDDQTFQQLATASVRLGRQLLFKSRDIFCGYPMRLMVTLPHDHLRTPKRRTYLPSLCVSQSDKMSDFVHWLIPQRESQLNDGYDPSATG